MAKQTIGIGTLPNDGTGDPLRTAMDKVNDNFTELYNIDIDTQATDDYTLILTDNLKLVTMDYASACTVTVPPESAVNFPVGALILIAQYGAGQVTFVEGSGVTINSVDSALSLTGQYVTASLIKTAADTWLLTGSLE
jgi:hypothetical protein